MKAQTRQLAVPLLAAVGAGIVVALLTGAVQLDQLIKLPGAVIARFTSGSPLVSGEGSGSEYSAVYLTNGRVYFAKASNFDALTVKLTAVYLLRRAEAPPARPAPEGQDEDSDASIVAPAEAVDFELVRLVDQYPQPTDEMIVPREAILYWEELPASSRVVKAIQAEGEKSQ